MNRRSSVAVIVVLVVVVAAGVLVWRARDSGSAVAERTVAIESVIVEDSVLRLGFVAGDEGCGASGGVVADETNTTVRLTARIRYDTTGGRSVCPLAGRQITEEVRLSRPLGDRLVIDGKSGRTVMVTRPAPAGDPA